MKIFIPLLVFCFFITNVALSAENKSQTAKMTVEQTQILNSAERFKEASNKLRRFADDATRKKQSDCLKAFGNKEFCQCLADNTPVAVSFEFFVRIVTTPKDELGYSELVQENKDIVDVTLSAREKCVNK